MFYYSPKRFLSRAQQCANKNLLRDILSAFVTSVLSNLFSTFKTIWFTEISIEGVVNKAWGIQVFESLLHLQLYNYIMF